MPLKGQFPESYPTNRAFLGRSLLKPCSNAALHVIFRDFRRKSRIFKDSPSETATIFLENSTYLTRFPEESREGQRVSPKNGGKGNGYPRKIKGSSRHTRNYSAIARTTKNNTNFIHEITNLSWRTTRRITRSRSRVGSALFVGTNMWAQSLPRSALSVCVEDMYFDPVG